MKSILQGGVADAESIPPALLKEMYLVGNRPGHYRAFLSLLRNSKSWEAATRITAASSSRSCLFGGTRIGQSRQNASTIAR